MKKVIYVILTAAMIPAVTTANCALTGSGIASGNSFNGSVACSGPDSDSVTVNGTLTVSNTKINSISLYGTLNISNATIDSGTIAGNITGNNANLGDITVNGNVNLSGGSLGNLTLNGTAQLSNVKVNSITASGGGWFSDPSKIYLSNGTIVSGNITFTNGTQGVVLVSSGAKVMGTVSGGKIENQ